ncbi:hypothetical protein JCM10450v2_001304 [Rhodotorula kratochvilovae]
MCGSNAQLFFGLYVKAIPLIVAARAWTKVKPTLLGVDLLCARRRNGTLQTSTPGTGVASLPEDVWGIVKNFVGLETYGDAEHAFVLDFHGAAESDADPDDWDEANHCFRPRRFTTDHLKVCELCAEVLFDDGGGMPDIIGADKTTIRNFLHDFGLSLCTNKAYADHDPRSDLDASLPISLSNSPHSPDPQDFISSTQVGHAEHYEAQGIAPIPEAALALPSDATARFSRLLAVFPLEPVDIVAKHTSRGESATKEERKIDAERARKPSWFLLNHIRSCE